MVLDLDDEIAPWRNRPQQPGCRWWAVLRRSSGLRDLHLRFDRSPKGVMVEHSQLDQICFVAIACVLRMQVRQARSYSLAAMSFGATA